MVIGRAQPFSVICPTQPTARFAATADIEIGAACVADRPT